jgi:hypothetical protein
VLGLTEQKIYQRLQEFTNTNRYKSSGNWKQSESALDFYVVTSQTSINRKATSKIKLEKWDREEMPPGTGSRNTTAQVRVAGHCHLTGEGRDVAWRWQPNHSRALAARPQPRAGCRTGI